MNRVFFALNGAEAQAERLCGSRDRVGRIHMRRFPDDETWLRVEDDVRDRDVVVVAGLSRPDASTLPLLYTARTLRELGARHLSLVAPYLPYMRQDSAFAPGEAMTSRWFAELLSAYWDRLYTLDPHLHRLNSLDEIFTIPTHVASSARPVAMWLERHAPGAILVGPDEESRQWVQPVAELLGRRWAVLSKVRRGDHEVAIEVPDSLEASNDEVLLIDDIISTGGTLIVAREALARRGVEVRRAIGTHALFADDAEDRLQAAGFEEVVTTNSLAHRTNAIDILNELARELSKNEEDDESGGCA